MAMKKRFKSRKKWQGYFLKAIILGIIAIFSFAFIFKLLYAKIDVKIDNTKIIDYLVEDALGTYKLTDLATLNSMDFLLKYSLGIEKKKNTTLVSTDSNKAKEEENKEEKIEVDNKDNLKEPLIYLYNSHQTEEYKTNFLENFNVSNTVLIASYILKEYLNDLGIKAIVEKNKIKDILNENNWKYGYSYKASRMLLESAKKNNPSLAYFIDLHRDAGTYASTTVEIDSKKYAKLLLVVGVENPNYQKNLTEAEKIVELIKKENASLCRGITKKQGKGVNGVYNQDFDAHTFLIEIGGEYNTIEEINNTLKVLAKVLYNYVSEAQNEQKEN